jgi:hypothetical protein
MNNHYFKGLLNVLLNIIIYMLNLNELTEKESSRVVRDSSRLGIYTAHNGFT